MAMIAKRLRYLIQNFLMCLLISLILPVMALSAEEQTAASMVVHTSGAKDGKPFLTAVLEKVQSMPNYHFDSSLTCFAKAKPVTETGRFYFKNPNLVRFEALSAGALSGSIVVRQADGKIRAKSGAFFGMTMGLSPNSKLLQTPNGYNILQSDFATLIESVLKMLEGNLKCMVTDSPTSYPGLERAYILEVMRDPDSVVQRIALDAENKLPLEWSLFNGDKLFSVLHIQKLSATPTLANNIFTLDVSESGGKSLDGGAGGDKTVTERIQDNMSALSADSKLGMPILNEAKLAIGAMKVQFDSLEEETAQLLHDLKSQPGAATADTGPPSSQIAGEQNADRQNLPATPLSLFRRSLLTKAATIESIVYSLRKLEKGLQNLDTQMLSEEKTTAANGSGKQGNGPAFCNQWHEDLVEIDISTSKLYGMLESNSPDMNLITAEVRKMRMRGLALKSIVDQLSTKI